MRGRITAIMTVGLAIAIGMPLGAQKITDGGQGNGGSPHVKAEATVHGANIKLEYGRPYLKGRPESQMMPAGQPWRTGADQGDDHHERQAAHLRNGHARGRVRRTRSTPSPATRSGSCSSANSTSPGNGAFRIKRRWRLAKCR